MRMLFVSSRSVQEIVVYGPAMHGNVRLTDLIRRK